MKIAFLGWSGSFVGAIAGRRHRRRSRLFLWTRCFTPATSKAIPGMPGLYTFMPIGIIIGALLGGVGLGLVGGRDGGERRLTGLL